PPADCLLPTAILDGLSQLRECSLILADAEGSGAVAGTEMRYRMLETLREYAAEQLAPEEREQVQRAHAAYFLARAGEASPQLQAAEQKRRLDQLEIEHENLRAAGDWSLLREPRTALRLGVALRPFWHAHGHHREGLERLQAALARDYEEGAPAARAAAFV